LVARIEKAISTEKFRALIDRGDVGAIDRLLKATAQLAQLTGANAPTKIAQTDTDGRDIALLSDDERKVRVRELLAVAQQRAIDDGIILDVSENVNDTRP